MSTLREQREHHLDVLLNERYKLLKKHKEQNFTSSMRTCKIEKNQKEIEEITVPGISIYLFGIDGKKDIFTYAHIIDIMKLLLLRHSTNKEYAITMQKYIDDTMILEQQEPEEPEDKFEIEINK